MDSKHGASVHVVRSALSVAPVPRGKSRPVNTGATEHVISRALSVVPAPRGRSKPVNTGTPVHVTCPQGKVKACEQGGICTCGKYSFEFVPGTRGSQGHLTRGHLYSCKCGTCPQGDVKACEHGASVHVVSTALSVVPAPLGKSLPVDMGHLYMW